MYWLGEWRVWQDDPQWEGIKESLTDCELTLEEWVGV